MAATKETLKVKDFAETVKGITGLVKENYLNGAKFTLSFWEESLKLLHTQVDQLLNLQQSHIKTGKELYEKFPEEVKTFWNGNLQTINDEIDHLTAFQKGYVSSVRNVSDKFRKETLSLSQKNVEKALSVFHAYLNLFR